MPAAASTRPPGRERQRRRTRKAIVQATIDLLARGRTPSVADVAEAADVSRRTVYMYFPTLQQLLIDAALGALTQAPIDDAVASAAADGDAEARVEALIRAISRLAADTLPLGRTLLRLTVDPGADEQPAQPPRRGYRRIEWIERALAPISGQLDEAGFERLVSALAMVVGWEALIVLRDVRGLSPAEEEAITVWAARALVRAALAEAPSP